MAEDAIAYVTVTPSAKNFGADLQSQVGGQQVGGRVGDQVSGGILSKVGGIGLGIAGAIGGAVTISAGAIAGLALKGGFARALSIQDAQAQLKGLGHDAGSIQTIMDSALASVKGTAFGLGDAAKVAATAVAAGVQPGADLTKYLTTIADASAIAGTSLGDMGAIINQTTASGKVYTGTLNQLADRGLPIFQWLAERYGVSQEALSKMVSAGQVDSATFQDVIAKNIGGAALASGTTAAGAWANVQASLGRLGAMFVGGAVTAAPGLFQAIAKATDSAATALKPYTDAFNAWLIPAIASFATWIGTIDFSKVIGGVQGMYDLIVNGDFSGKLREAFGLEEDSGFVTFILDARDAIKGLFSGDVTGSMSGFGTNLGAIGQIASPLMPIFVQVAQGIGSVATSIGGLIGQGINLLPPIIQAFAGALGFLNENSGLVVPILGAIGVAMLAYQASVIASNTADLVGLPIKAAMVASNFALAGAQYAAAGATGTSTVATRLSAAATALGNGNIVKQLAVMGAQKVALVAGAVATGVATAAQWLWNAAMDANPIGIIVLAIAALVGGLIWFFTQTQLGQDIWANFTSFLGTAWNWIVGIFQAVFDWVGQNWPLLLAIITGPIGLAILWIVDNWNGIVAFFQTAWSLIVAIVTFYVNMVMSVIIMVISAVMATWNAVWQGISDFFTGIWNFIVAVATMYVSMVLSIISGVINTVSGVWNSVWSGISSFFGGIWSGIISTIQNVQGVFSSVFNGIASVVSGAFNGIVSVVRNVINGVVDAVNGVLGAVNSVAGAVGGAIGVNLSVGRIPRLAEGGVISARPGGIIANIGEGRYDEAVVPLSPNVLDRLGGGSGGGIKSISFGNAVALLEEKITAQIEYHDGRMEQMILGGSVQ